MISRKINRYLFSFPMNKALYNSVLNEIRIEFFGFGRFTIYSDILFVDAQENISTQVYHIGG